MFPKWMDAAFDQGGGKISIEQFMRLALYHEEHGYYSANIKTVGRGGDFSTSATLHQTLGDAISAWLENRNVIEVGGGNGALAESVLDSMGWWRRRKTRYHLVETSRPLREQQRSRLKKHGRGISWHESVDEALDACAGRADIFSNELVDAFPAVSLRWNTEKALWQEAWVDRDGNESLQPSDFTCDWQPQVDGQRIEWHRSFHDWMRAWIPKWKRGRMLTIDYGGTFPNLYYRRPQGSLRAYFAQMRLDGQAEFFQRAGRQDLTADVNFTDLIELGQELGLGGGSLQSQAEFLFESVPGWQQKAEQDPALAFLVDPAGAGSAFQVLQWQKHV